MGSRPKAAACSARYLGTHRAHPRGPRQRPTRPGDRSPGKRPPTWGASPRRLRERPGQKGCTARGPRQLRGPRVQLASLGKFVSVTVSRLFLFRSIFMFFFPSFVVSLAPFNFLVLFYSLFFQYEIYLIYISTISISSNTFFLFPIIVLLSFPIPNPNNIIFLTIQYDLSICFFVNGHASAVFSSLAMTYAADTIYTHRSYHRRVQVLKGKRGRSCFVPVNLKVNGKTCPLVGFVRNKEKLNIDWIINFTCHERTTGFLAQISQED